MCLAVPDCNQVCAIVECQEGMYGQLLLTICGAALLCRAGLIVAASSDVVSP